MALSFVSSAALVVAGGAVFGLLCGRLDDQEGFRFRIGVDLINVTATVTDRSGRFVPGLGQTDFAAYEDDRQVDITHFSTERVPAISASCWIRAGAWLTTRLSMRAPRSNADQLSIRMMKCSSMDSSQVRLLQDWTTNYAAVNALAGRAAIGTAMTTQWWRPFRGPKATAPQEGGRAHFRRRDTKAALTTETFA